MLCKTSFAPDTTHNNNNNDNVVEILLHLFLFRCLGFAPLLSVFLVNFDKTTCRLYDAQRVFDSDTQAAPLWLPPLLTTRTRSENVCLRLWLASNWAQAARLPLWLEYHSSAERDWHAHSPSLLRQERERTRTDTSTNVRVGWRDRVRATVWERTVRERTVWERQIVLPIILATSAGCLDLKTIYGIPSALVFGNNSTLVDFLHFLKYKQKTVYLFYANAYNRQKEAW